MCWIHIGLDLKYHGSKFFLLRLDLALYGLTWSRSWSEINQGVQNLAYAKIINRRAKEEISLTSREIEVLEQLSKGLKYNAIAENLFLSPGTIRKHVENIYTKLQVHNKLEAIQKAKNNKLI